MLKPCLFVLSGAFLVLVLGLACSSADKAQELPAPRAVTVPPPAVDAPKPVDMPGVHNVVTYAPGMYSGSVPEGDEGFETLANMGVRTIISVDGGPPEVEKAKAHGIRYVHLPIGYDTVGKERTLELAKAIDALPGPVYVHCHHGKHRSAGALGAATVTLGKLSCDEAVARMKVSGTAANYTGLYASVTGAHAIDGETLAALPANFQERVMPEGLTKTMVTVDEVNEELKEIEKAGWKVPADHPDLVPVAVAGRLADLFRVTAETKEAASHSNEFVDWMRADAKKAKALEELLRNNASAKELGDAMKLLQQSCKDCHKKYRD
jgi:protein tyrosine phosphatase (PTP) superfamily phosphohydrolase (DUF442 family)